MTRTYDDNHVDDFVDVESVGGRHEVILYTQDGERRLLLAVPDMAMADALRDAIMETLATWDGWSPPMADDADDACEVCGEADHHTVACTELAREAFYRENPA